MRHAAISSSLTSRLFWYIVSSSQTCTSSPVSVVVLLIISTTISAVSKGSPRQFAAMRIVAIDHFHGSPEHQAGGEFASATLVKEGTTIHRFRDNLKRVGLIDHVQPIEASPKPPHAGPGQFGWSLLTATILMNRRERISRHGRRSW